MSDMKSDMVMEDLLRLWLWHGYGIGYGCPRIFRIFQLYDKLPIGSMYAIYGNIYH